MLSALASCAHGVVQAQSIDYGALEQLFQEPVTASATGSPQRVADVPANMEIVTAEDIRRSGAYDLPGILRHVTGVDFQQWTANQAEISVRGYDQPFSQRVLVLINGRQVYADDDSFTPWSALPVELGDIRQIEIVRGPGSALFGFDAVGGVINIITYDPLYDNVDTASVSAGSQQLAQGSASVTLPLGKAGGLGISGGARSDQDFPNTAAAASSDLTGRINQRRNANLDATVRLNDSTSLRVEASTTRVRENLFSSAYQYDFDHFESQSIKGQLSSDGVYGLLQLTAYTNYLDQISTVGVLGMPVNLKDRISVAQAEDVFKLGASNTFRAAVEYRRESTNTSPITGADVFYSVISGSGMWSWQLSPALALTNALRLDQLALGRDGYTPPDYPFANSDWDRNLHQPSYNSGLVWKLGDNDTVRLMAARGSLLPNLVELGSLLAHEPGLGISGTPTLAPTVVDNYEIDWDRELPQLHARLRTALFYTFTDDMTAVTGAVLPGPTGVYVTPQNIGDSHALGTTFTLTGKLPEHWRWGANLRLERLRDSFSSAAATNADLADPRYASPDVLANLNLGWSAGRWESDVYALYQSRTVGLSSNGFTAATRVTVPAFCSVDARVAWQLNKHLGLALSGQNLLHARQLQTSGEPVQRRWLATITAGL
jgi:outer membrane receptor for ferrienterochelin and colicins